MPKRLARRLVDEHRAAQLPVRRGLRRHPADRPAAGVRHRRGGGVLRRRAVRPAGADADRRPRLHADGQLRAALGAALHLHGLRARAGRHRRGDLPRRPRLGRADPRRPGGGGDHLVRADGGDGRRDRRRDRDDGRRRAAGDAVARLQEGARARLHLRRRRPGDADPAERRLHHVRPDRRRLDRPALRRRRDPGADAGGDVHRLHRHPLQVPARLRAAGERRGARDLAAPEVRAAEGADPARPRRLQRPRLALPRLGDADGGGRRRRRRRGLRHVLEQEASAGPSCAAPPRTRPRSR